MENEKNTYSDMFSEIRALSKSEKYSNLPLQYQSRAFANACMSNPYIRNSMLKRRHSTPVKFGRNDIERIIQDRHSKEKELRQTASALQSTSYPFYKLKKNYTDILTYKWYYRPLYLKKTMDKTEQEVFSKERIFVDKFCKKLNPTMYARIITGQILTEGKAAYYIRYNFDKSKNKVNAVVLEPLPSDYIKIVGYNSESHFTVAFNFAYFWQTGTNIDDFPPIFQQYYNLLNSVSTKNKVIDFSKTKDLQGVNASLQNGKYYFWVTLPIDECFVFGTDFTDALQAPMLMGMFLAGHDLTSYELLQQELMKIPLYSFLTGEIPYHDEGKGGKKTDDFRLSPDGYDYYEQLFYNMMAQNNTQGIDFLLLPASDIKLHRLDIIPESASIAREAHTDFILKAGISGIQSATDKPTAPLVATAQKIEKRYADMIYDQFSNMVNVTLKKLGLTYDWHFSMFGDIFSDEKVLERLKTDLSTGQSYMLYHKLALEGLTLQDAVDMSLDVLNCGIYDLMQNVESAYNPQSQTEKKQGRKPMHYGDIENENTAQTVDRVGADVE